MADDNESKDNLRDVNDKTRLAPNGDSSSQKSSAPDLEDTRLIKTRLHRPSGKFKNADFTRLNAKVVSQTPAAPGTKDDAGQPQSHSTRAANGQLQERDLTRMKDRRTTPSMPPDMTPDATRVKAQLSSASSASGAAAGNGPKTDPSSDITRFPNVATGNQRPLPFSQPKTGSVPSSEALSSTPDYVVLKRRFVLVETLGVGGMGVVYKAKDLRKVEAKDRNPYIAVKILSEDFRQHPEAFISLQREARKSQSIAHPNIVNVHDFDRDGDTVFMTMEYMEGRPLDKLLREFKGRGLPRNDVLSILKGICAALEHAHSENIVHADFKPGNIFVTKTGAIKVFDFGIARAVAQVDKQIHHHDRSIFDPHTLGALTPTYASCEMLQGASPTSQDDIYALACVTYEMFTGRHPFDRLPADQAAAKKLKPKRISFLTKQQWKALRKALAFQRKDRTTTVHEFIWDFTHEQSSTVAKWITLIVLLGIAGGVYWQYYYVKPLTPEQLKAQLQQQIKIDLAKEQINKLIQNARFTELWEAEVWQEVQAARTLMGEKDKWLLDAESDIVKLYVEQIIKHQEKERFSEAQSLLARAQRYRGDKQLLETQSLALQKAIEDYNEKQRLAKERELAQQRERELAAEKARQAQARAKPQPVKPPSPPEEEQQATSSKDIFALALANVKQQLRCKNDINTRDLGAAVRKLKSVDQTKYQMEEPSVVSGLAVCIEKIGEEDSNRAEDLKDFALQLFPGNRVLAKIRITPKDPCSKTKAGLGRRGQSGACRDRLYTGGYGPRLVVIPAGEGLTEYAIGQHEVAVEDINEYCKDSKACKVITDRNGQWPVTNISVDEAKDYARWLSSKTGYRYRLPRYKEWLYAAKADNSSLDDNRNCRLNSRGIVKGDQLQEVTAGAKNNWGLVNHVGNAQEWVLYNNRDLFAVGGAHTDPIQQCNYDSKIKHSGNPDAITGFRLVRELR